MPKLHLFLIALIALISVWLMTPSEAINFSQIELLKNQFLPAEYRNTNFSLGELKSVFKAKCLKVTGVENSTLYREVESQALIFTKCITGLANLTSLQQEIETSRPIGELDTVFHKYCLKAPQGSKCLQQFNTAIQPCLSKREQDQNAIMMRIFTGLLDFMCARGGDQVALFVAEEGPECLEANREAIVHCANTTLSEFVPKENTTMPDLLNLPDLVFEPEHCVDFVKFETCTLHHLEQCREITPANVAESVFRFVKNETNCKSWLKNKANQKTVLKRSAAADLAHLTTPFVFLITAFVAARNIV